MFAMLLKRLRTNTDILPVPAVDKPYRVGK